MHCRKAWPTSSSWMNCSGSDGTSTGSGTGELRTSSPRRRPSCARRSGTRLLAPTACGPRTIGGRSRYRSSSGWASDSSVQEALDLGLLLGVEEVRRRTRGPFLGDALGVVAVEAVGGDRRGVDEALRAGRGCGPERVERPFDVDRADRLARTGAAGDHEREVHDDVGVAEGFFERVRLPDVALAVLHLRPAVLGGIEGPACDADDAADPVVGLQERHQPVAEGPGRAGDGDGERSGGSGHSRARPYLLAAPAPATSVCAATRRRRLQRGVRVSRAGER